MKTLAQINGMMPVTVGPYRTVESESGQIDYAYSASGLTKRELFAAMAMQGILANPDPTERTFEEDAGCAVVCADALLDALAKEATGTETP